MCRARCYSAAVRARRGVVVPRLTPPPHLRRFGIAARDPARRLDKE